ncbi:hypothetical protein M885DRAFT_526837 [Pelagophyceae sp. CCMP2097]|nr:hypothetical protein M885DRAFT_526837 [Pelagophyceae sp. CCMP2097]
MSARRRVARLCGWSLGGIVPKQVVRRRAAALCAFAAALVTELVATNAFHLVATLRLFHAVAAPLASLHARGGQVQRIVFVALTKAFVPAFGAEEAAAAAADLAVEFRRAVSGFVDADKGAVGRRAPVHVARTVDEALERKLRRFQLCHAAASGADVERRQRL